MWMRLSVAVGLLAVAAGCALSHERDGARPHDGGAEICEPHFGEPVFLDGTDEDWTVIALAEGPSGELWLILTAPNATFSLDWWLMRIDGSVTTLIAPAEFDCEQLFHGVALVFSPEGPIAIWRGPPGCLTASDYASSLLGSLAFGWDGNARAPSTRLRNGGFGGHAGAVWLGGRVVASAPSTGGWCSACYIELDSRGQPLEGFTDVDMAGYPAPPVRELPLRFEPGSPPSLAVREDELIGMAEGPSGELVFFEADTRLTMSDHQVLEGSEGHSGIGRPTVDSSGTAAVTWSVFVTRRDQVSYLALIETDGATTVRTTREQISGLQWIGERFAAFRDRGRGRRATREVVLMTQALDVLHVMALPDETRFGLATTDGRLFLIGDEPRPWIATAECL